MIQTGRPKPRTTDEIPTNSDLSFLVGGSGGVLYDQLGAAA